jgi:hypothetical protein
MKLVYKIFLLFVPPVFYPNNLKKIKKFILDVVFSRKDSPIVFEKAFFKRHAFINKAVGQFSNCNYLEIGVAENDVFNTIPLPLKNKFGVDPFSGGNYRMTSDDFFEKYPKLKFDVIFVDGLHHYLSCQKDVINSMNALNKNGIILIDDLIPKNSREEAVPRKHDYWTGDVWKVAVELFNSKNVVFKIVNIDSGIGILKLKDNFEYIKIPELQNKNFSDFLNYYKNFQLINSEEALNFISSNNES